MYPEFYFALRNFATRLDRLCSGKRASVKSIRLLAPRRGGVQQFEALWLALVSSETQQRATLPFMKLFRRRRTTLYLLIRHRREEAAHVPILTAPSNDIYSNRAVFVTEILFGMSRTYALPLRPTRLLHLLKRIIPLYDKK